MSNKIAGIISIIFYPFIPAGIFFAYYFLFEHRLDIYQIGLFLFLDLGIPAVYVFYLLKKRIINNIDISDVHKRKYFYFPVILFLGFTLPLFVALRMPSELTLVQIGFLIWLICWAIISLFYKISGHVGGASFVFGVVYYLLGNQFWPLFLFLPLLAWSRVKLKQHTIDQTITGAILGFLIAFAVFNILNRL